MSSQKRLFLTTRFKIERTKNQRGSCKFLAIFTKTLIERYSGKDLRRVGLSDVGSDADWETALLAFDEFQENSRPGSF